MSQKEGGIQTQTDFIEKLAFNMLFGVSCICKLTFQVTESGPSRVEIFSNFKTAFSDISVELFENPDIMTSTCTCSNC